MANNSTNDVLKMIFRAQLVQLEDNYQQIFCFQGLSFQKLRSLYTYRMIYRLHVNVTRKANSKLKLKLAK